jgi:starvation-inducible DNA-binding protein
LHHAIAQTADLADADTSDLYNEVSRTIDKRLWFLEAHLQTSSNGNNGTPAAKNTNKVAV